MAMVSQVEIDLCSELALLPGSVFEFTSRFIPAKRLPPLLALYAFKQAIGSIPRSSADDAIKWTKLNWWHGEIEAEPDSVSRHPVLRALWQSGARAHLHNDLLKKLVIDALLQIDAAPDSDEKAMFEQCSTLGSTEIQLELALDQTALEDHALSFLAAASRLFQLISSFAANPQPETDRLPLGILAKYNVSAVQLQQNLNPVELNQIIEQLAEVGMDWFSEGMSNLKFSPAGGVCDHLQLRWAMENRRLAFVRKNPRAFLDSGKRFGPADAWFAWRFLRRLR